MCVQGQHHHERHLLSRLNRVDEMQHSRMHIACGTMCSAVSGLFDAWPLGRRAQEQGDRAEGEAMIMSRMSRRGDAFLVGWPDA